jgi:3'-phosphoadenosine 5'-phosphosulfate sulfotransferase (PAPS reductase)/FAD synthetase
MTPYQHTAMTLKYLREQSPEVILFYSGGKDSVVLLDLISPYFDKIHCIFMDFVPDMDHLKPFKKWVERYKNAELTVFPHWMTSYYMKHNYYSFPRPGKKQIRVFKQVDVEEKAKKLTGCEWIVFGHKMADSMVRRLMLKGYKFNAINQSGKKIYPLSMWSKKQVVSYIEMKSLIKPVEYGRKNSNGLDLTLDVFLWLQKYHPGDLQKILNVFPLAEKILFEHEHTKK